MNDQPSLDPVHKSVQKSSTGEPRSTDATGPYVSQAATKPEVQVPPPPAGSPTIPGYVITGIIAKGGMGVVYAAQDLKFDREVAIKMSLPGNDAERFITEAKITARLPHPGIPPVHDLGKLNDGSHYLAMKLIRGQTLSHLLQSRDGPTADLPRYVQIFEQIAQAVGFAHSRGIIHRDLKPLNVMVGEFGEVQVMDWGLAKALGGEAARWRGSATDSPTHDPTTSPPHHPTTSRLHHPTTSTPNNLTTPPPHDLTAAGAVMGTPGYMAPEQARGDVVDARADVFALGSMLANILTGKPAFVGANRTELIRKSIAADLADAYSRLDACGADADLVNLARRCLAANREDRPVDGQAVASEVAAYRAGVEARLRQAETDRARAETRAAEQAKRRRVVQWAGGLIAAVLLIGLGASLWQMDRAIAAEKQARDERDAKGVALQQAEENLGYAKKGNELLGSVFTGLDPKANYATVGEFRDALKANLAKAIEELEGSAIGDPLAVAKMQDTLGRSLMGLGDPESAIVVLEKALTSCQALLGIDHPDTLATVHNLARAHQAAGRLPEAIMLYEQVREAFVNKLGADHSDTLITLNNLAGAYSDAGRLAEAIPLFEQVREAFLNKRGADHPDTLGTLNNLAVVYLAAGRLTEAIPLYEKVSAACVTKLGADHPYTLTTLGNLAGAYQDAGKLAEAITVFEQVYGAQVQKLGAEHPGTLITLNNLAGAYWNAGKLAEAITLHEKVREARLKKLGADHPDTLTTLDNLAGAYQAAGRLPEAIPLYEQVREVKVRKLGTDHPSTLTTLDNLAGGYRVAGRLAEAIPLYEQVRDARVMKLGADHPDTLATLNNLAVAYQAAGQDDKALPLFQEAAAGMEKRQFQHQHAGQIVANLISGYVKLEQFDAAETWQRKWLARVQKQVGAQHPAYAVELSALSLLLLKQQKWTEAESVLRESLAIREQKNPDAWSTFTTHSLLGAALLGRAGRVSDGTEKTDLLAAAEPLLIKGYEGMKERSDKIPEAVRKTRLTEALDRLIELHEAMAKPDEVKKWQAERASLGE